MAPGSISGYTGHVLYVDEAFALDTTNFSRLPTPTATTIYRGPWYSEARYFDKPKQRDDKAAYRAMAANQHKCRRK